MKVVIIGAGNVATHIAMRLAAKGVTPLQIWSHTKESADRLARLVGSSHITNMDDVVSDADAYIISVKDSALEAIVSSLCKNTGNGVYLHTAGTMPTSIFAGHCNRYGVIYPMQTFSKQKVLDFSKIPCFIDANDKETLDFVRSIAGLLSEKVYEMAEEDRRWLHIAAVFACNFSNACCAMASRILAAHGIDFNVMLPLIDETMDKLHFLSPEKAQTGPAVRTDYNVMELHERLLGAYPELKTVYEAISKTIIDMKVGKANI